MIALDLSGKTALVTGGGQGLGLATASLLYQAGATVVINYFDDPAGVNRQRALEAVSALGERAVPLQADVRNRDHVAALMGEIAARCGGLDILVNNAAVIRDRTVRKMAYDEWDSVIDTNLTGVFNVCKAAMDHLRDGGRIVNMASISGQVGAFGQANYSAAKAGVVGFTKTLSRELAARNITVNAVAPGLALTEMGRTVPESIRDAMLSQIPLKRFAEPHEIATVVLFLCSDLASYVTGQTLHVNGGWWG